MGGMLVLEWAYFGKEYVRSCRLSHPSHLEVPPQSSIELIVYAWAKVRQTQMNKLTLPTTQPSSAAILRVTRIFWFRVRLCVSHFSSD
jgi:hypothetical protein